MDDESAGTAIFCFFFFAKRVYGEALLTAPKTPPLSVLTGVAGGAHAECLGPGAAPGQTTFGRGLAGSLRWRCTNRFGGGEKV